jgi:hypothetical protein
MRLLGKAGTVGLACVTAAALLAGASGLARSAHAQAPPPAAPPPAAPAPAAVPGIPVLPPAESTAIASLPEGVPESVPMARFYGQVVDANSGEPPSNATIIAYVGDVQCSKSTGNGTDNYGHYTLDLYAVPGCTTPGASVRFTVNDLTTEQHGTVPDLPGTAIHLDLTVAQATPTPAPRPSVVATVAPPPPPVRTPPPAATPATVQAPRVQGPRGVQGPKAVQAPKAVQRPAYGAGGAPAAVAPRLPSTGTGGLLDQSGGASGWMLAAVLLAALGMGASGLVAYRREQ